jgi:hypothetical protein
MGLLTYIEMVLEKIAPNLSKFASIIANVASVMASISWLVTQAWKFMGVHNNTYEH